MSEKRSGQASSASAAEDMKGCRVLLVGGAGFLGHHLALGLAARGAEVVVVDSLQIKNLAAFQASNPDLDTPERCKRIIHDRLELLDRAGVELYVQDVRDYQPLGQLLNRQIRPNVVVHLAAIAQTSGSNKDPYNTFDHSLRTLENLLDTCRDHEYHFIYPSSDAVYGETDSSPLVEELPLKPLGIYGALKAAGERLVTAYNQVFDLPFTILRTGPVYGPRSATRRIGEVLIDLAADRRRLVVHGELTDRVDLTHVSDFVDGVCLVINQRAARGEVLNLTSEQQASVAAVVALAQAHLPELEVELTPPDGLLPRNNVLSIEKARRLLGYEPGHSLEAGLARYFEWYREIL